MHIWIYTYGGLYMYVYMYIYNYMYMYAPVAGSIISATEMGLSTCKYECVRVCERERAHALERELSISIVLRFRERTLYFHHSTNFTLKR